MANKTPILQQQNWTQATLTAAHFKYCEPKKRLVMARILREMKTVEITLETLVAKAGDIIVYAPSDKVLPNIDDYDHWPVRSDLFRQSYKPWNDANWRPGPVHEHLMKNGCRPFYKSMGVWAKRLRKGQYVQSLESLQPVLVSAGRWLCIGTQGEPYHMSDADFRERYIAPPESVAERLYWALLGSFARREPAD